MSNRDKPVLQSNNSEQIVEEKKNFMEVNHFEIIYQKICNLFSQRDGSNVLLVVGKKEFPIHPLILSTSSDVFMVMLMDPKWSEACQQRVVLYEEPECIEVFDGFLKYFYTGIIQICHENVLPLLILSDKYNVKELITVCVTYIKENIATSARANHFFLWANYAIKCSHRDLSELFMSHLKWNFEQVSNCDQFGSCDVGLLTKALSQHDLVVHDELRLFHIIAKWLSCQEDLMNIAHKEDEPLYKREDLNYYTLKLMTSRNTCKCKSFEDSFDYQEYLTYETMKYIRFPMMTSKELADLLINPLTLKYKNFFLERMALGKAFLSGKEEGMMSAFLSRSDTSNQLLFTPRAYTCGKWSAQIRIEMNNIAAFSYKTLLMSTFPSVSEFEQSPCQFEWGFLIYPRGYHFPKAVMQINKTERLVLPKKLFKDVRIVVHCQNAKFARVRIDALMYRVKHDVQYVVHHASSKFIFNKEEKRLCISDVFPFEELNKSNNTGQLEDFVLRICVSPLPDPRSNTLTNNLIENDHPTASKRKISYTFNFQKKYRKASNSSNRH